MFEYDGVEYDVGTVVAFEFGRRCEIGVIVDIASNGLDLICTIAQPSGRLRVRTLDHDVKQGLMAQIPPGEADFLDTDKWKHRYEMKLKEQG